jgi:hypothetical protein
VRIHLCCKLRVVVSVSHGWSGDESRSGPPLSAGMCWSSSTGWSITAVQQKRPGQLFVDSSSSGVQSSSEP